MIPGSGSYPVEGNGNPLQYSYLENSMGRGACQATVCLVNLQSIQGTRNSYNLVEKQNKMSNLKIGKGSEDDKDEQMVNRYMKRCSASLSREMQIKATVRYYLTLVRIIKKISVGPDVEERASLYFAGM